MKFKTSVKNTSDYNYSERTAALSRIQRIPHREEKLLALKQFQCDEIRILSQRTNPLVRSQALSAAQRSINSIEQDINHEQHGTPDSIQALQRRLFDGDARQEPLAVPLRFNFFRQILPELSAGVRQLDLGDDADISLSNPQG